jgi:hypothetical protein
VRFIWTLGESNLSAHPYVPCFTEIYKWTVCMQAFRVSMCTWLPVLYRLAIGMNLFGTLFIFFEQNLVTLWICFHIQIILNVFSCLYGVICNLPWRSW